MIQVSGQVVSKRQRVIQHCYDYSRRYAKNPNGSADTLTEFTAPSPSPRNTSVWMNSVDFSSAPVWVHTLGVYTLGGRGCVVTPLHHVQAAHNGLQVGDGLGFIGTDGNAYSRTIADVETFALDMQVNLLSSALPAAVVPAKILPTTDTHFTSGDFATGIRSVMIGQYADLVSQVWNGYSGDYLVTGNETLDSDIATYTRSRINGDSGSPNYLIINNEAVFIGTNRFPQALTGPHRQRAEFDAAITALGSGGYSVSVVDLSGFDP